ncbi:O-antigen ligase [Dietzia sp. 111N12-1]|uniref:O-antigen ligase family protein n=1 Tax=Dietzia sp. 111N12-1 TaxID=1785156 RepID=UPI0012E93A9F|nr:O-antigen ligase family protein [Dietzia sp. 111N12-1]
MFALFAAVSLTLLAFGGYAGGTLAQLGFPVNPILIGAVGTAIAAGWTAIRRPESLRGITAPLVLWATMISGFVNSTRSTGYADGKFSQLLTLTPLMAFGAVILLAIPEVRSRLVWCLVAWGGLVAALQFLNPAEAGNPLTISAEGSTYQNYGFAVGAAAVILLVLAVRKSASAIPFLVVGAGFMWLAMLSGSRGPVIAALIAVLAGFASTRLPAFVTITGAAVAFVTVQYADLWQFLPERLQTLEGDSTDARVAMVQSAWEEFLANPIGLGWGELQPYMALIGPGLAYPHNVFAEVAAEAGIFGLAGLVGYALYSLVGQYRAASGGIESAIFALTVFTIGNAAVSGDIISNRGMHLFLAAGVAAWVIRKNTPPAAALEDEAEAAPVKTFDFASGRWT